MDDDPTSVQTEAVQDGPGAPAQAHAPALLRAAIERHAAVIYRLARSIVGDSALADDVVQETLIKAWRAAPLDENGELPRAWLMRVARNTAISMLRTRREDLRAAEELPEDPSPITVARVVEGRGALRELQEVLAHLDVNDRALIVLREVDGMSYEEIAATMGLALPTVKTRLFRARQVLKRQLEGWR